MSCKYECGHTTSGVIILNGRSAMAMSTWISWALEEGNLKSKKECFDCYLGHSRKKRDSVEVKG